MWDLFSRLSMPVGLFHGEIDANTPIESVRGLEARAKQAGKSNLEFHYFDGLGHGLGSTEYFSQGRHSPGYAAIFAFVGRVIK